MKEVIQDELITDINSGYEEALEYSIVDRFTVKLIWWHLASFILLVITNSLLRLADYVRSPFSWRVISFEEAGVALIIAFFASLLPFLFLNKVKNHYYYRLLITFCLILYSYLFVFITGGAIEAHFHFFIVIGYLTSYADWRLGWFALLLTFIHHMVLDFYAPHWVFFYGFNLLSPLAHTIPVIVAAGLTTVLCKTRREALISQKEVEKRKDEFISMASHELKTPVTSITIFTEVLQRSLKSKGQKEYGKYFLRINEQLGKLTKLISDLLDVSRIQADKFSYHFEKLTINGLVREMVESVRPISPKHTITVRGKVLKKVLADSDRIGQVLTNFLTNAIKYSPSANKIDITLSQNKTHAFVCVRDFGLGIDAKHQSMIFERFYRVLDDDQKTYPGMGMGLYISSEIIRKHNGEIWFTSEKGKGSKFYFSLPFVNKVK